MNRCLIVTMNEEALPLAATLRKLGVGCAYLDFCPETSEFVRANRPEEPVIRVGHQKSAVLESEGIRSFDTAVVFEGVWLSSALIVQALKQAGVQKVVVVARNQSFMRAYRALGADRVVGRARWNRDSLRVLRAV